ncbi:TFDP [Enterospora canceri]|uniref:TFDP n=1 Tax=Enterospora canceri TaxID=1081671 RepID=A0A1Y1S4H6_9MICR|nr:TFDP [Enterospora canceri]
MFESDTLLSDAKKEGMKYITQSVYAILKEKKEATYQQIVQEINTTNMETKVRRIYDVLNVLRAVNVIGKNGKIYFLIEDKENVNKKIEERDRLLQMKEAFEFITTKNRHNRPLGADEKLYLPFMIVSTETCSEIHCDTNEERDYFLFRSNRPLKIHEDLDILRLLQETKNRSQDKKKLKSLFLGDFMF